MRGHHPGHGVRSLRASPRAHRLHACVQWHTAAHPRGEGQRADNPEARATSRGQQEPIGTEAGAELPPVSSQATRRTTRPGTREESGLCPSSSCASALPSLPSLAACDSTWKGSPFSSMRRVLRWTTQAVVTRQSTGETPAAPPSTQQAIMRKDHGEVKEGAAPCVPAPSRAEGSTIV